VRALAFLTLVCGCHSLPEIARGNCGNHIVEAGEDCDAADDPHCMPSVCRFRCSADGTIACASGSFCGRDGICRKPTGNYTLGPELGHGTQSVTVTDIDSDGFPDLIARTDTNLSLLRNDGQGQFSEIARGSARARPDTRPQAVFSDAAVAFRPQPSAAPQALLAITPTGVDTMAVWPTGEAAPLIVPTSRLPIENQAFLFTRAHDSAPEALVYVDPDFHLFRLPQDLGAGIDAIDSGAFVGDCDLASYPGQSSLSATRDGRSLISMTLISGFDGVDFTFCVLSADSQGGLVATNLGVKGKLPIPNDVNAPEAVLADFDGDLRVDAAAFLQSPDGTFELDIWSGDDEGHFAAPKVFPMVTTMQPILFGAADLDEDGIAELIASDQIFHISPAGVVASSVPPLPPVGFAGAVASDFNRDGHQDVAYWSSSDAYVCFGDGHLRFYCQTLNVPLQRVALALPADLNGDGTGDLAIQSLLLTRTSGQMTEDSRIAIARGRAFDSLMLEPVSIATLGPGMAFGSLPAPAGQTSQGLIFEFDSFNGLNPQIGTTEGDSDAIPRCSLHFGADTSLKDVLADDFDGDGVVDLQVLHQAVGGQLLLTNFPFGADSPFVQRTTVDLGVGAATRDAVRLVQLPSSAAGGRILPTVIGIPTDQTGVFVISQNPDGSLNRFSALFPRAPTIPSLQLERGVRTPDGGMEFVIYLGGEQNCFGVVLHIGGDGSIALRQFDFGTCTTAGNFGFGSRVLVADASPADGLLDLYARGDTAWTLFRQTPDGSYIQDGSASPLTFSTASGPLPPYAVDLAWLGTQDFNGDGIADLLLVDSFFAVVRVALADVERR
jgi:hypothetical protein